MRKKFSLSRFGATLSILLVGACATTAPTRYTPFREDGGFSDAAGPGKTYVARFTTAKDAVQDAIALSYFRALEFCREKGFKFAEAYCAVERSGHKTEPASTRNWIGKDDSCPSIAGRYVRNRTIDTYFTCENEFYMLGVLFKDPNADGETEKHADGFVVEQLMPMSPNMQLVKPGDVLTSIRGIKPKNVHHLRHIVNSGSNQSVASAEIKRAGKPIKVNLKAMDNASILESAHAKFIAQVCMDYPDAAGRVICGNSGSEVIREIQSQP